MQPELNLISTSKWWCSSSSNRQHRIYVRLDNVFLLLEINSNENIKSINALNKISSIKWWKNDLNSFYKRNTFSLLNYYEFDLILFSMRYFIFSILTKWVALPAAMKFIVDEETKTTSHWPINYRNWNTNSLYKWWFTHKTWYSCTCFCAFYSLCCPCCCYCYCSCWFVFYLDNFEFTLIRMAMTYVYMSYIIQLISCFGYTNTIYKRVSRVIVYTRSPFKWIRAV